MRQLHCGSGRRFGGEYGPCTERGVSGNIMKGACRKSLTICARFSVWGCGFHTVSGAISWRLSVEFDVSSAAEETCHSVYVFCVHLGYIRLSESNIVGRVYACFANILLVNLGYTGEIIVSVVAVATFRFTRALSLSQNADGGHATCVIVPEALSVRM